jgi:hypothetical protein
LLPPLGPHLDEPKGDYNNGHENDAKNVEGNVGHRDGVENAEGNVGHVDDAENAKGNVGHGDETEIAKDVEGDEAAATNSSQKKAVAREKETKHKGVGKKMVDVKSNADGIATVSRRKRGAASEVPLEKCANGRKRMTTATARRGAGSCSRGVRGDRVSARRGGGQGSGVPKVVDEEEL